MATADEEDDRDSGELFNPHQERWHPAEEAMADLEEAVQRLTPEIWDPEIKPPTRKDSHHHDDGSNGN